MSQRPPRIKGCAWPASAASALASHYSPAAAYEPGDVIKIGQYLATGRTGGAYDMGIWAIMRHGTTLAKTDGTALNGVNWSTGSPIDTPSITGTRMNLKTGGVSPPSSGAAIAAAYAAITNAAAGFNLSDIAFAVSAQWAAGGNLPDSGTFSKETFEGADAYYVCTRTIAASSNSPASLGAYGAHPLLAAYWDLLPDYTAGEARSDCGSLNTENAYENIFCGRCGRLL